MGLFIYRHVRVAQTDTCAFTAAPPLELGELLHHDDSTINIGIVLLLSLIVLRPHRSTTYVDAVYSYRPSSMVCLSIGLYVCRSVTLVSPAKTAAPIELPFGLRTWVGPGNHVLDGGPDPSMGRGKFWGRMGIPL